MAEAHREGSHPTQAMKEKTLQRLAIACGSLFVLAAVHMLYFWGSVSTAEAGRSVALARYEACVEEAPVGAARCAQAESALTSAVAEVDELRAWTRLTGTVAFVFALAAAGSGLLLWRRRTNVPNGARG
jgi:hypothetical protein